MTEDELIARHIEPHPSKAGRQEARLRDSGISVWALVAYLPAVEGDVSRVAADYELTAEAVEAALAYYRRHKALFDAHLLLYEESFR